MVLLVALPVRFCLERLKPWKDPDLDEGWKQELTGWDRKYPEPKVLFGYPNPVEAMFYTGSLIYAELPGREILYGVARQGYRIFVRTTDSMSDTSGYGAAGVTFVRIPAKAE